MYGIFTIIYLDLVDFYGNQSHGCLWVCHNHRRLQTLESSLATKSEEEPLGFNVRFSFLWRGLMISKLCVLLAYVYTMIWVYTVVHMWLYMCYFFNLYIFGGGEVLPLTVTLVHDCFEFGSLKLKNGNVILVGDCCWLWEHRNLDYIP